MIVTNIHGLPDPLFRAIKGKDRDTGRSDYSVTELLQPARQLYLERKYAKMLSVDASTEKDTFLGTAADEYVRSYAEYPWESCERVFVDIEVDGQVCTISGEADLYDHSTHLLVDLKVPGEFEYHHPKIEKWYQLAMYKYLYGQHGYQVDAIANAFVLKDWKITQSVFKKDYAPTPILMHYWDDLPDDEWTLEFIKGRIRAHRDASEDTLCSDAERWIENKWAVMKEDGSRAENGGIFDTEEAAEGFRSTLSGEHEIEFRPGQPRRCEYWCKASEWCLQFQGEK